jgi:hypothetical protein
LQAHLSSVAFVVFAEHFIRVICRARVSDAVIVTKETVFQFVSVVIDLIRLTPANVESFQHRISQLAVEIKLCLATIVTVMIAALHLRMIWATCRLFVLTAIQDLGSRKKSAVVMAGTLL